MPSTPAGLEPSIVLGVLLWCLILAAAAAAGSDDTNDAGVRWKRWRGGEEFLGEPMAEGAGSGGWDVERDGGDARAADAP